MGSGLEDFFSARVPGVRPAPQTSDVIRISGFMQEIRTRAPQIIYPFRVLVSTSAGTLIVQIADADLGARRAWSFLRRDSTYQTLGSSHLSKQPRCCYICGLMRLLNGGWLWRYSTRYLGMVGFSKGDFGHRQPEGAYIGYSMDARYVRLHILWASRRLKA